MKKIGLLILVFFGIGLIVSPPVAAQSLPSCGQGQANGLTDGDIDHYDLVCFSQIPDSFITNAKNRRFLWVDRSVGLNIHDGLNCLASGVSYANAPSSCKSGLSESEYISDTKYFRNNWEVAHYGDGGWYDDVRNYIVNSGLQDAARQSFTPNYDSYSVINYQFSYLDVATGSDIISPTSGFFANNTSTTRDIYDMRAFEANHPSVTFVYATSSLARSVGTSTAQSFNNQMRQYALSNNIPLIDFADIGSHDPQGSPCFDNSGAYPALCVNYTAEAFGGHLNPAAKLRTSKAMWLLMASLSGWNPGGAVNTPTPTAVSVSADANGDGKVDGVDYIIWLGHFNQTASSGRSVGDFNNSGRVDIPDYIIWVSGYGV